MTRTEIHLQLDRKNLIEAHSTNNGNTNWIRIESEIDPCNSLYLFFKTKEQAKRVADALRDS